MPRLYPGGRAPAKASEIRNGSGTLPGYLPGQHGWADSGSEEHY